MHDFWHQVRAEPEGPLIVAANAVGLILVIWLLVIA